MEERQPTQVGAVTTEVMLVQLLVVFSMKCYQKKMVAGVQAHTSSMLLDPWLSPKLQGYDSASVVAEQPLLSLVP